MQEELVKILKEKGWTISTAESCTGGLVASKLVEVDGVSSVLKEAYVTYAPEAKEKILGVSMKIIDTYGVVSETVAEHMAKGLHNITGADVCLATTGIAGPTGGTDKTPVGTVCFAIYIRGKFFKFTEHFGNVGRNRVRDEAAKFIILKAVRILHFENFK